MGRYACAIVLAAGLSACATTSSPPVPIPEVGYVCNLPEELPERHAWMTAPPHVGGVARVRELGGTNKDLWYVFVRDAEAARTAGTRLKMAETHIELLEEIIRGGCYDPR